ncbi:MAG: carbon-nitrogen hydrolase family protein [Oscillospiraceae bacterium]
MKIFRIAMVQHRTSSSDIEENTALAIDFIREAKSGGADMVLFPECFLTSYEFPGICGTLKPVVEIEHDTEFISWCNNALDDDSPYLDRVRQTAAELDIGVVITAFTKGRKYPQNTAYIIGRDGSVLLKYSKVHTCDFDRERYLEGGEKFGVCSFDGISIGVMICYDREYPESARELMLQGAELIMLPNDCGDMKPFRLRELSVEAMQNMVGIAMANPPSETGGCSCAFSPVVWGRDDNLIIAASETFDGLVYAEFDMEEIREYRRCEDMGKYRKAGAYGHLTNPV